MPVERVNGIDLHVQELGDGPVVALIHGLIVGSLATWYFTTAPALARRRRVLMYDLRGHGKSERARTGYDLPTQAADLHALLGRVPAKPVSLAGHCFGGLVALRYALTHPDRVDRLVLIDVPLPPSVLGDSLRPVDQAPEEIFGVLPGFVQEQVSRGSRQARRLLELFEFHQKESSLIEDLRREPDFSARELGRLACPVLCLYGTDSFFLPVSERLADALPDARLRVLPGSHYLPYEAAKDVTRQMVEFLHG